MHFHPLPLLLLSPQPCHKTFFLSDLYYLCQQRAYGSIRPSWEVQIVTGVMWTGSLHMPLLVPSSSSQSSANHRLGIYLHEFNSALCHFFTLCCRRKRLDNKNKREKNIQENHSISQHSTVALGELFLNLKPPHPQLQS